MAWGTAIEWADHTFNPWWGCAKVSEACAHCYAETFSKRLGLPIWGAGEGASRKFFGEAHWREPEKWNRQAEKLGVRYRVFCASMADVFEGPETIPAAAVGAIELARCRLFRLILDTPHLDWLLLTKRPGNIWPVFGAWLRTTAIWNHISARKIDPAGLPANVWVGTTVENQARADERIPELMKVPAAVRFLSMEPLLGPVDLASWYTVAEFRRLVAEDVKKGHYDPEGLRLTLDPHTFETVGAEEDILPGLHWVIAGGESGHGARPMHPAWVREVRDQCQAAGVPFFFKQWGEWAPGSHPDRPKADQYWFESDGTYVNRLGKKAAGRLLDGQEYSGLPSPGVAL